jgi:hypothetical protein
MMVAGYRSLRQALPLLVLLFVTACASAGASTEAVSDTGAEPGQHIITVHNDHGSFSEITVYIIPAVGMQQALGTVPANETRSFNFEGRRGSYHLLLRRPTGDARSDTFNLPDSGVAEWRTSQRRVLIRSR